MPRLRQTASLFLFCLLSALVVELFTHCGSPFSDSIYEPDQHCFFMSAKAWWNGLLPYRDCADVKGPLLSLFYMAGYLITPTSFLGVFIVQVFWSALLFLILYKTARMFLGVTPSILALTLALGSLYFPYYHDSGSRAEDIMLVPLAVLLYAFCRYTLKPREASSDREFLLLCACNGLVAWIFFFIKYNMCFLNVALAAWLVVEACKRGVVTKSLLATCAGGCIVLLPVLTYFLMTGTFGDMIDVYILLNRDSFGNLAHKVAFGEAMIGSHGITLILTCFWLAGIMWLRAPLRVKLLLMLCYAITRALSFWPWVYYSQICSFFGIFPAIALLQRLPCLTGWKALTVAACTLAGVLLLSPRTNLTNALGLSRGSVSSQHPIVQYLQRKPNRKLLYLNGLDAGFGTSSHLLPAGPFWFTLNGIPEWCKNRQRELYRKRQADFVVIFTADMGFYRLDELTTDLPRYGYRRVMEIDNESYSSALRKTRVWKNTHILYEKTEMAAATSDLPR